ncbi:hypothetical protein LJC53_01935 [Bacteroidales bacterium OttesenSCG-928-C03]|nr:hypothetical protein [Bacteroidales bacterium OttesenSCG-928-C03]MDL2326343.1 hypothetical protein [Bacteroidales bacterium OttesenSCG-928-A14]
MNNETPYYFPWVRKGLNNHLTEEDTLGNLNSLDEDTKSKLARQRVLLSITAEFDLTLTGEKKTAEPNPEETNSEEEEPLPQSETKEVQLVGPGDIIRIKTNAILKTTPNSGSIGFPVDYYPYIEFWEPDFPWRYTPAAAKDNKLRPWLALLVWQAELCKIKYLDDGRPYVSLIINTDEEYHNVFPHVYNTWKSAHAQGVDPEEAQFSRLLARRNTGSMKTNTQYVALLVPAFETGRLRGLGYEEDVLESVIAQAPAWEESLDLQRSNHKQPLDFPVYHSWYFTTGEESFDELAKKLAIAQGKSGIDIDVSRMGEGLDYNVLTDAPPERNVIKMPTATRTLFYQVGETFPSPDPKSDEKELYANFKKLISSSPVFEENRLAIEGKAGLVQLGDDDPWVTPPIYGGKHILATSIDEDYNMQNKTPWLSQLNLDVHYRAVAGLGKKTVQTHQEEFVNRAWQQIEAVNALNHELYKKILSISVNESLRNKLFDFSENGNSHFIAQMMKNLGSMLTAQANSSGKSPISLESIMKDSNIPKSFASPPFFRNMEIVAKHAEGLNADSIMDNIAENHVFKLSEHYIERAPSVELLRRATDSIYKVILDKVCERLSEYFYITKRDQMPAYMINSNETYRVSARLVSFNDTPGHSDSHHIVLPENHIRHYWNFFDETSNINQKIGDFFAEGLDQHISSGYTTLQIVKAKSNSSSASGRFTVAGPNVLVLHDEKYAQLFGSNNVITRVGGENGFYFVPRYGIQKAMEKDEILRNAIKLFINLPSYNCDKFGMGEILQSPRYYLSELFYDITNTSWNIKLSNKKYGIKLTSLDWKIGCFIMEHDNDSHQSGYYLSDCYYPFINFLNPLKALYERTEVGHGIGHNYIGYGSELEKVNWSQYDIYQKNMEKALDYLWGTPDSIEMDTEKLSSHIQCFDTLIDYAEFLKKTPDAMNSWFRNWVDLDNYVKELEAEKSLRGDAHEENHKINVAAAKNYKDAFKDFEGWQEMIDTAERYYDNFYKNKCLQQRFIEELLLSKYPIMAYPTFPEPVYFYLKMFSDEFILPGVDELPEDSVSMYMSNEPFVEAYLSGMNTEMGRELLWREYPTDQRGSYFRKFWDSETSLKDIMQDNFFDIQPVHAWRGNEQRGTEGYLGDNHAESKTGLLLFTIKGKLLRQYPTTRIFLQKAVVKTKKNDPKNKQEGIKAFGKTLIFDPDATEGNGRLIMPLVQAFMREDTYIIGFKKEFDDLLGNPAKEDYGYFLTFLEDVEDLNFQEDVNLEDPENGAENAANVAKELKNEPTLFGKHLSLFII